MTRITRAATRYWPWRWALAALVVLTATTSLDAAGDTFEFFQPVLPPRSVGVMAHGGNAVQTPKNAPAAIDFCIADGLEWIALEVRQTKDNRNVVFSGGQLEGQSSGAGLVSGVTLDEFKQLDVGSWFARRFAGAHPLTLEECLARVKGKINLCLDCQGCQVEALVREIQSAGLERQVLVSGAPAVLSRVRELSGGKIALLATLNAGETAALGLEELKPAAVEIDVAGVTSEVCRQLHERGIKVVARTLGVSDNAAAWQRAIDAGADLLRSELPEEVVAHALWKKMPERAARVTCHRGASRYAPENTLPAFAKAARLHADFVEFDVRPSRDGEFFLLHDKQLNRTTGGRGAINDSSAEAIARLDAGAWFGRPFVGTRMPTLEEFLSAVPASVSLYFDAKDIPPEALAKAIQAHQLAERTIVYQSAGYLEKLKAIDPRIRALPPASTAAQVTALAAGLKPYGVDTPWPMLSKKYIDHCHAAGIQVFSDAPGLADVKAYRQAIEWGIDVIQTDYPLRAYRALELVAGERAKQ